MNIIIPLAGTGERFKEDGYDMPKSLIMVHGEPLIFHVLRKIWLSVGCEIYIVYHQSLDRYGFQQLVKREFPTRGINFVRLNFPTRGAVETVLCGLRKVKHPDQPTLIMDGDTFYENPLPTANSNTLYYFETKNEAPIYSYFNIGVNGFVHSIKEKEKISDLACSGAYHFLNGSKLMSACEAVLESEDKSKGEYYISDVIRHMLVAEIEKFDAIPAGPFHCLGTPQQLKAYCMTEDAKATKRRFCFDLDGTLATLPGIPRDYSTIRPIERNVARLRYLKALGHTIIIETARGSKSGDNKTGKAQREVMAFLAEHDIPFDEIYFNKPHADFYVDDLSINPALDVDKAIGFYNGATEPRHFNSVEIGHISVKKLTANPGEVYWYNNIPARIKEYFPKTVKLEGNEILMEKINGIPLTYLYVNGSMTKSDLLLLFQIMRDIHITGTATTTLPIYANYGQKLLQRYTNYDYSSFGMSQYVYDKLRHKLMDYAEKDLAQIGVIHGDMVFSNIFLCDNRMLRFIDMRGKLGDVETIYGDIFYDYAKVYQSLVGYDYILAGKENDMGAYNNGLVEYFKILFIDRFGMEMWGRLQVLTASLLFSLIPLHTNKKKQELYFKLCESLL